MPATARGLQCSEANSRGQTDRPNLSLRHADRQTYRVVLSAAFCG